MSTESQPLESRAAVIRWLLDADPAIGWQVMSDLTDEPEEVVAAERARVAAEGWGARLLDLQGPDGQWGGATWRSPGWTATSDTLELLRDLGVDPADERTRRAIGLVRDNCTWGEEFGDNPFFEGEVEPCINGRVLACGAYFGEISEPLVERLLSEQMEDGGWNCYAPPSKVSSFHSTICVLEGLLEYEQAKGASTEITTARLRSHEYFLERRLFRSLRTGGVIDSEWTQFSFPTHWHYDVLWGLDYMRRAGVAPEPRMAETIDLVESKRGDDGRWLLDCLHTGEVHFEIEGVGQPSRWITLRALRVLDWFSSHI